MDSDVDPGLSFSPRMLLFLIPGYLAIPARRGEQDGLALTRQVWVAFFLAPPMVGIVADQERLWDRGCQLSLVGALRQPGPP